MLYNIMLVHAVESKYYALTDRYLPKWEKVQRLCLKTYPYKLPTKLLEQHSFAKVHSYK